MNAGDREAGDRAWSELKGLQSGAAPKWRRRPDVVAATPAEAAKVRTEREAERQRYLAVERSARDFQQRYPAHPRAAEARRVELLAGLQAVSARDKAHQRSVLDSAAAYRASKAIPVSDRYAIAHAMESREITLRLPGRPWFVNPVLAEDMLDRLRVEFAESPEVWAGFLTLADNTYCDAGRDVAYRIVQSPYAPEATQAAARKILERYALVRRRFDFSVAPVHGAPTKIPALAGETTVVCLWDGTKYPEGVSGLAGYKKNPRPNTNWIYIAIGQPGTLPKGRKPHEGPPGVSCVEAQGWKSPLLAQLHVTRLPYVFVLGPGAMLSGYGTIDQLPELLNGIGRPVIP